MNIGKAHKKQLAASWLIVAAFAVWASAGNPQTLLERATRSAREAANPYEGQPAEAKAGEKLFRHHCAACHGEDALGIGKAPPLMTSRVRNARPAVLFWVLRNGSRATGMPSFSKLPDQQRWQIVTWLTAANGTSR